MINSSQKHIGNLILNSLDKIEGFDLKWNSLISSKPLLFEDINYFKIKNLIDETITDVELKAYKSGKLREIYPNFDTLLILNLRYYNRIINYCTMVLFNYVEINGLNYNEGLKKLPIELTLTPTKIWCAVFANEHSTKWELEYGLNVKHLKDPIQNSSKSILEVNYKHIYNNNKVFAKFNEYNSIRLNTNGYRSCYLVENTPNRKLAKVCNKFTKTSVALSEEQLDNIYLYTKEINSITERLYKSLDECLSIMFGGDKTQYSIYIFMNEFYIFTSKFSLRVNKDNGKISKDYLANSYECFLAEKYLVKSIQSQIEWSKFNLDVTYDYDKTILTNLLTKLLSDDFKEIVCILKPLKLDVWKDKEKDDIKLVKCTFTGIFNNVKINEHFMINNRVIKTNTKVLSRKNAAKYLIDKGYYLFGYKNDIDKILDLETITKNELILHYSNYCIPVINYMNDIINLYKLMHQEIINIYTEKTSVKNIDFANDEIIYTSIKSKDEFSLKNINSDKNRLNKINDSLKSNKKSYWQAIENN